MLRDVLAGVFIAWLSLTPEGKKVKDMAIKKVMDTYLLPKKEKPKNENVEGPTDQQH